VGATVNTADDDGPALQPPRARLLAAKAAARYLGIGTTLFATLDITQVRIGRRVLYDLIDLDDWVDDHKSRGRAIKEKTWPEKKDFTDARTRLTGGSSLSSRTDAKYVEALGLKS
jgi:hypothetical protein